MAVIATPKASPAKEQPLLRRSRKLSSAQRPNYVAGFFAVLWLVIVMVPVYVLVKASVQDQGQYVSQGPLSVPTHLTTDNFKLVFQDGFRASS